MQKYIDAYFKEKITLDELSCAAGYSKYHATRIFKELTGKTPFESIRALRLTKAAQSLRDSDQKVVDVALDNGFESHDGFTRTFVHQFDITPQRYQHETPIIKYFIQYPIEAYYILKGCINTMELEYNKSLPGGYEIAELPLAHRIHVVIRINVQILRNFMFYTIY